VRRVAAIRDGDRRWVKCTVPVTQVDQIVGDGSRIANGEYIQLAVPVEVGQSDSSRVDRTAERGQCVETAISIAEKDNVADNEVDLTVSIQICRQRVVTQWGGNRKGCILEGPVAVP